MRARENFRVRMEKWKGKLVMWVKNVESFGLVQNLFFIRFSLLTKFLVAILQLISTQLSIDNFHHRPKTS